MKKVPRSERTNAEIRRFFEEGMKGSTDPKSELVRLAVRSIVEEALEGAVRDLLGRGYYERGDGAGRGYRNGYREGRLKTGEGEVRYGVPQVRDVDNGAIRALQEHAKGRTEALEALAVEMYARGLSSRDIEDTFRSEDGSSLLSRTAVSEITETLWAQYEEFATRELSDIEVLYLFLDGVAERLRPGAKREAVLCAWCITWTGEKVLLHLSPGTKESTECCKEFLQDMTRRGLKAPVLVVTDGAAGLIRAVEECFPFSLRQRCLAHKMRNISNKLPEEIRAEFKVSARASYEAPSQAMARALRDDLVERFEKSYPSAVQCFLEDFDACIAHLLVPPSHRKVARTTNLLERLFGEERRRTKVAPSMFGERPVLKMMYAATLRASQRWRGITITEFERASLQRLREQLDEENKKETKPAIKALGSAQKKRRVYSRNRT